MNPKTLVQTVALAQSIGHVLVATADSKGLPHVAPADKMTLIPEGKKVTVEAWFCPGTVASLQSNRQIALVIWDSKADKGYQVLGLTEGVEDIALLDGLAPGVESMLPQGKKRLYIRVAKVMAFQHAPHTDQEQ
jgi:general stress protein 26